MKVITKPTFHRVNDNLYEFINADNFLYNTSYLVIKNKQAVVIDPSFNSEKIIERIKYLDLELVGILLTHGHWDHWIWAKILTDFSNLQIQCHKRDQRTIAYGLKRIKNYDPDYSSSNFDIATVNFHNWKDDELIKFNDLEFKILLCPGHSPGSVCFQYDDYVFSGDHVFDDSVGRTDLYLSSPQEMQESLEKFLKIYNDQQLILPGHAGKAFLKDIRPILNKILIDLKSR